MLAATPEVREMQIQSLPPAVQKRARQLEMPVLYREAVAALEKCATMDEAKYYSDKSDALAAWAKIYGSDEDSRAAARLKLKAYARMGQLAGELRPAHSFQAGKRGGQLPGPVALLVEHGLKVTQANAARGLAKISSEEFEGLLDNKSIKSPNSTYRELTKKGSEWNRLFPRMSQFRSFCRANDPNLSKTFSSDEAASAIRLTTEIIEWIDEFDRCIPK